MKKDYFHTKFNYIIRLIDVYHKTLAFGEYPEADFKLVNEHLKFSASFIDRQISDALSHLLSHPSKRGSFEDIDEETYFKFELDYGNTYYIHCFKNYEYKCVTSQVEQN